MCTRTQIHNYELRWNIERDGGAGVGAGGRGGGEGGYPGMTMGTKVHTAGLIASSLSPSR